MDFRSLLQSFSKITEGETKDTKTGRVHKGTYGTSYEAGDEGVKKQDTQRGRGRPKKDADETGEVKKYDSSALSAAMGGGKKPSGKVGTVSAKHSIKEGETIEKKGGRVHKGSYGTSYEAGDEGVKKAETQRGRGRPKKGADDSGEVKSYDSSALNNVFGGKKPSKAVGTVSKKHSLKEYMESVEDTKHAEAVFESIMEGVDHTSIANNLAKLARVIKSVQTPEQFAVAQKYAQRMSGTIQQHQHAGMGFGSGLRANIGVSRDIQNDLKRKAAELGIDYQALEEENITIKPMPGASQIVGQDGETIGTADAQTANVLKQAADKGTLNLGGQKMAEGKKAKPDFLDVDDDKNEKESFKKAVSDKEKAKEKVKESISFNEMSQEAQLDAQEMLAELQDDIENFVSTGHCSDKLEAFLKVHGHSKKKIADEGTIQDFTQHGMDAKPSKFVAVDPAQKPTPWKVDPIQATTDRAIAGAQKAGSFIKGLVAPSKTFESTDMKDMQVESWEKQLNGLLTEGITVSSSQGQQGAPDSVSVTANDADAQQLLAVLRQAGLGVFGGGEQPTSNYGAPMPAHGEEPEGNGTEPEASPEVADADDDIMSLIKKMTGIEQGGAQPQTLEPAQGGEEGGEDYKDEEGSEEQSQGSEEESGEEEVTDEGNDGNLANNAEPYDEITQGDVVAGRLGKDEEGGHAEHEHEETCSDCGQASCECGDEEEKVEEGYANEPDEEMAKLKALLSMGNDMHRMKGSQAVGNPVRVAESNMINDWKKLSGIK
jgi:hypothetical protein